MNGEKNLTLQTWIQHKQQSERTVPLPGCRLEKEGGGSCFWMVEVKTRREIGKGWMRCCSGVCALRALSSQTGSWVYYACEWGGGDTYTPPPHLHLPGGVSLSGCGRWRKLVLFWPRSQAAQLALAGRGRGQGRLTWCVFFKHARRGDAAAFWQHPGEKKKWKRSCCRHSEPLRGAVQLTGEEAELGREGKGRQQLDGMKAAGEPLALPAWKRSDSRGSSFCVKLLIYDWN